MLWSVAIALLVLGLLAAGAVGLLLRGGGAERWLGLVPIRRDGRSAVLFYAASHGELLLLKQLLPRLARERPDVESIIIVPRPSVLRLARDRLPHYRSHCVTPLSPLAHGRVLRRLAAELFVIVEFARIPLWARAARRLGVPLTIVNGRINQRNLRACRRWPWLFRPLLYGCGRILVQTAADAERFRQQGAQAAAIEITGAMKYEAAVGDRQARATRRLAALARIAPGDVVLLGGSTTGHEEETLAEVFEQLAPTYPQLRLILVPKNRRRFASVAQMLERRGLKFQRRSELETAGAERAARVLLVDTVGELAWWWGVARIGFVGASLVPRGGHNMIEPAALGVATCFGPHTDDFRDVVAALSSYDAAVPVANSAELRTFVRRCLEEPAFAASLGQRAQIVCRSQTGATLQTCQQLVQFLDQQHGQAVLTLPAAAAPSGRLRAA
ncbi:MAG TPA: glycosyltransferase N-terminal domain-containing protein [Pirellulaceae bacterium]|nr:glycosyltransferase N-terminal domain-containing protein [Pirellulaceae bacterium]